MCNSPCMLASHGEDGDGSGITQPCTSCTTTYSLIQDVSSDVNLVQKLFFWETNSLR